MILDIRCREAGTCIEADICVVGGGPAGIAIARAFIGSATQVCLLESGGWRWSGRQQSLYRGRNVGHCYFDLEHTRVRHLGGSSNRWGGFCRPLDAIDFEARDWLPYSGWPLTYEELNPYYRAAEELCGITSRGYRAEDWFTLEERVLQLEPAAWQSLVWQLSPRTNFGQRYRQDLESAKNIHVYLHANATSIRVTDDGRVVQGLEVRTLDGATYSIRARHYVLACGGLETPRLLLASNEVCLNGIGNQHDLVGRFFMEHPHTYGAKLILGKNASQLLGQPYFDFSFEFGARRGRPFKGMLNLTDEFQRQQRLTNIDFAFYRARFPESASAAAMIRLWQAAQRRMWPEQALADIVKLLRDLPSVGRTGLRWLGWSNGTPRQLVIRSSCEQAPNPESRVTLDRERDALGMPRLVLDWRLSAIDRRSISFAYRHLADSLGRAGIGQVALEPWVTAPDLDSSEFEGGYHHIGTTRMGASPKTGVVNRDCRLFELRNLFIAGSSVFPTSGSANPMLTTVALALRLADHLRNARARNR